MQPFPGPGGKWQASTNGGITPSWRRDGKELYYIAPDGKLMAVPIQGAGQKLEASAPVALFQTRIVGGGILGSRRQQYVVAPDGQRFLMNVIDEEVAATPITIVLNWTAALRK